MKIQLINAPLSEKIIPSTRSGVFPPVNLVSLGTYLNYTIKDIEIEILDGDILSYNKLTELIDADFVGIGSTIMSYSQATELAKTAKKKGSTVIFGGQHVSALWKYVLKNRKEVDYLVIGDGEETLAAIVQDEEKRSIPNLAFRKNGDIIKTRIINFDLNKTPILDFGDIDLQPYWKNFSKLESFKSYTKCAGIYIQKGCSWQNAGGGCVFCRNSLSQFQVKKPEKVWQEIINLNRKYKIDFFHDVSDEFTANFDWLKLFTNLKPNNISPGLFIFARADQITPNVAKLLKKINCVEVLLGVETGDNKILKRAYKPLTVDENKRATLLLRDVGIKVYPTFLFGLPGETKKTIEKTIRLAEELVSYGNVDEISCSILLPIPSAPSFQMLCSKSDLQGKFKTDLLDPDELRRIWAEKFCNVTIEELEEAIKYTSGVAPIVNKFGMKFN